MKKKITMKDIAKELDVSVSTVSKALNNSHEISQDTIDKVKAFAKLYNYRPNNIALSLKNKKTKNIAVIIPEIVHHFFTMIISGIEQQANKMGYNVVVCLSNESFDREVVNIDTMANGIIDGFLVSLSKETLQKKDFHHLREIVNQGMPLVMFDRVSDEIYCDKVVIDDARASYNTVKHLLHSGCRRIALLTTPDYITVGKLRTQGYINAMLDEGLNVDFELIVKIESEKEAENKIKTLFDSQSFDAVFGVNELYAVIAMKEALVRGVKIPDQISFVGFTDGVLSKYAYPSLTTVAQHGYEMGEKAVEMLVNRLENSSLEDNYYTEVIKTSLLERDSTKLV